MITSYTRADQLISQERDGVTSYYLYDGFDSVRMLADDEGAITDTYTYDAFGNLISSTGETVNDFLYRGEQFDSFTGLYYLRARYMNPSTGTFITMDEYAGSIFEPVSLHKYLYANANPVTYSDPSGYSIDNDLKFYKQAWLSIEEALEYEAKLVSSVHNEIAYNNNVREIGSKILEQLRDTAIEIAVTTLLTPYVGPNFAALIANGTVTLFDICKKHRDQRINDALDDFFDDDGNLMIGDYKFVKGHHVFSKAGFDGSIGYDKKTGFSISNEFMEKMGWDHDAMTSTQHTSFTSLFKSGKENTLMEHVRVAYDALIAGGASKEEAGIVVTFALVDMLSKGVLSPFKIPWH